MFRTVITLGLILLTSVIGCENSSDSPPPEENPNAGYLLGLNRNHQLHYAVYDSLVIISLDGADTVIYDTSYLDIQITRGVNNQVELAVDGVPNDLLTDDNIGVLHSGQIRPQAVPPDTLFFYPTPVVMPGQFGNDAVWSIEPPPYATDSGEVRRTLLYFYYGYYTQRRYLSRENMILPTGSYDTYHFQSSLFPDISSPDTLIIIDEYFAPNVGPVKIVARFGHSQRLILLLEDN